jgi:hypothetical protein
LLPGILSADDAVKVEFGGQVDHPALTDGSPFQGFDPE